MRDRIGAHTIKIIQIVDVNLTFALLKGREREKKEKK